ncbi:Helix-turn-helix domain-containing protein [Paenibacillus sp. UNCCL117]|uniref:helix-turn-helix domain-containing protein n=1 Tax=unclassified Paenibacillus TaxID=185978 RepID=UPI00088D12F6|nr:MULTISPECIES: helix-turn-helix transcriptional regulator [unclassified Paenibacillus]SDC69110.1 Helix-turn-helix domain-containing protein [Paenibacillus sp. cl123]SFW23816.1 Helix-turn-helix domain-containing protein [Paenibacillus sp. UNCCL117]
MTEYKITIRTAREEAGMSLEKAAQDIGVSVKRLKWYELHGSRIPVNMARKLAETYGVSTDEIHFGTEEDCDGWNLSVMRRDVIQRIVNFGISPERAEIMVSSLESKLLAVIQGEEELAL